MRKTKETAVPLFHGTSGKAFIRGLFTLGGELFGARHSLDGHYDPSMSGTLTDDADVAKLAAIAASMRTGGNRAYVINIELPEKLVRDEGVIAGHTKARGFSTKIRALAVDLPDEYLKQIGLSRDEAIKREREGEVSFYRVPGEALKSYEAIGE